MKKKKHIILLELLIFLSSLPLIAQTSEINPLILSSGYQRASSGSSKSEMIIGQIFVGRQTTQKSTAEFGFFIGQREESSVLDDYLRNTLVIMQNRPNPAKDFTVIPYSIDLYGLVTLEVFSVLGQSVQSVQLGEKTPGNHFARIDCSEIVPGVYFYKITINDVSKFKVMIKL